MRVRRQKRIDVIDTLERVRACTGLSLERMSEFMGLQCHEYLELLESREIPSAQAIFKLLEEIPLAFEKLMEGDLDEDALRSQYQNDEAKLPEKYTLAAHSRVRTLQTVLLFLETHYGWQAKEAVIRYFQIPAPLLKDPNAKVNIQLIAEVYEYISKYYVHPEQLDKVGAFSLYVNQTSPLSTLFQKSKSLKAGYEQTFLQAMPLFDENFNYSIESIKGEVLKVGVVQNQDIAEVLKRKNLSNEVGCVIRGGVGASFSGFLRVSAAHVNETKCVHRGDPLCLYEFNLERPNDELKRKLKPRSLLLDQR